MSDGRLAQLQDAYVAKLTADSGVQAIFGSTPRIWQDVPANAVLPYLSIGGEDQEIPDLADCVDGSEIYLTLHVWAKDYRTCKNGAEAINVALHETDLSLDDYAVIVCYRHGMRFMRDADGITKHGVVTFRLLVDSYA